MLIQDSTPAYGAKKVQDFLKENLPLMYPKTLNVLFGPALSGPAYLNVYDYWLFNIIEREINVTLHPNVKLSEAFRNLDPKDVKEVVHIFAQKSQNLFTQRVIT